MKMTLEEIRREYDRLDRLCGVDTSGIRLEASTRLRTRLGYCQYQGTRPVKIVIASFLLAMGDAEVLDTARHEYAHALVKLRRPRETHGHDAVWKAAAAEVGCTPRSTCQDAEINAYCKDRRNTQSVKYIVRCLTCGRTWEYKRKGRVVSALLSHPRTRRFLCPVCGGGRFSLENAP